MEAFDKEKGYVKSVTNIYDIEKISVEFNKPKCVFHSVVSFEICQKFEKLASTIKYKIFEFENSIEKKNSLEIFLDRLKAINKDIKIN